MVLGIGIPAGIISSVKPNSWIDQLVFGGALLAAAIPTFWLGLNLMLVFGVILKWLPSCGFPSVVRSGNIANLRYLVLPSFSLAIPNAALLARITRSSMLDVLFRDYIVTATAKGLSQFKVVMKHALRTASIPIVTTAGFTFATLLSGTVVTETVFGLPGVGRLIVEAVQSRDYPVIQGILLVVAISYVFINFTTDIAYGFLDPRVRYV
jgi:peptide/nickel transport system permease protein